MSVVNASNAVIAKARAKYGKRLTEKDLIAMTKCTSVDEIVRYLKSYTSYYLYLDKVSNSIHRGNLENILKEKLFENFLSLCRYNSDRSPITKYILRRTEIRELIRMVTLLSIGKPEEYIFTLPIYFIDHAQIDLQALSKVRTHNDLITALEYTDYQKIIRLYRPDQDGIYNIPDIEYALQTHSVQLLYDDINRIKNKKARTQLLTIIDRLCDNHNYTRIMRLKKYYHQKNELIRHYLLPFGSLTGRNLDRIFSEESYEEVRAALANNTAVGRRAQKIDIHHEMAVQGRYNACHRELYFSTNPDVVLLSYFIVSETELTNLITIIESVRYSIDSKIIQEMLIV